MRRAFIPGRQVLGEVPRSGGGEATSGAGAKRKEGAQPPGDAAHAMGTAL